MANIKTSFNIVDGVFVKQMVFDHAGDLMPGHKHTHDHLTLLARGRLKVTVNNTVTEFKAPHMIFIHKDHVHELQALEPQTVAYCIHAVRDRDTGNIIDHLIIPKGLDLEDITV